LAVTTQPELTLVHAVLQSRAGRRLIKDVFSGTVTQHFSDVRNALYAIMHNNMFLMHLKMDVAVISISLLRGY